MDIVSESDAFELHPVSGEIDFGDVEEIRYRRLDEETLQARVGLTDLQITIIYLWCDGDQEVSGSGWRVSEVRPLESDSNNAVKSWSSTVFEADGKARDTMMDDALRQGEDNSLATGDAHETDNGTRAAEQTQGDNDDDYWASYDKTPGVTPAPKSPGPSTVLNARTKPTSEAEYFGRYAQVQPEMDNDDPSEDRTTFGESTLNGDTITSTTQTAARLDEPQMRGSIALPNGSGNEITDGGIHQPSASAPRSRSSTVSKLEESAETQSLAESAIMHHVSTSIKSLYRLCRSSGIERSEFDRMIRNEMDTLSMIDEEDNFDIP